jgi:hypothetical protein
MIKSEDWFGRWRVGTRALSTELREARLNHTGPSYTEGLGRSGRTARYYRTHEVMAWKGGANKLTRRSRKMPPREYESLKAQIESSEQTIANLREIINTQIEELRELLRMSRLSQCLIGVYFLIRNKEIVYVGQSTSIYARVAAHHADKEFTHFSYIKCPSSHLRSLEALYIAKFSPILNGKNSLSSSTAAIEYQSLIAEAQREMRGEWREGRG